MCRSLTAQSISAECPSGNVPITICPLPNFLYDSLQSIIGPDPDSVCVEHRNRDRVTGKIHLNPWVVDRGLSAEVTPNNRRFKGLI